MEHKATKQNEKTAENQNEKQEEKEKRKLRRRQYYEKNRYIISKRTMEQYIPNSIKRIKAVMSDKVDEYAAQYSFYDIEKYIRYALKAHGISKNRAMYDECFSNASLGYYYSICRCAFCGYTYVVPYIRKMIGIAIICGINLSDETDAICKANNLKPVNCDTGKGI